MTSPQIGVAEAERLLEQVSRGKEAGKQIADLRFPPTAELAAGARWRPVDARGVVFRNLEWTHGSIEGRLFGRARVQECQFEGVNLDDFTAKKVDFVDCRFENVTFGQDFLGLVKDCSLTNCSFTRCRFDAVGFVESTLRSCRFEEPSGTARARWEDCLLEDVSFTGVVDGVRFIGSTFRNTDMSRAKLHDVFFHSNQGGEPKLPDRPDNFVIDAHVFLDVEAAAGPRLEPRVLDTYRELAKVLSRFGSPFVVDTLLLETLLTGMTPHDRAVVMRILYDLRQTRPAWTSAEAPAG